MWRKLCYEGVVECRVGARSVASVHSVQDTFIEVPIPVHSIYEDYQLSWMVWGTHGLYELIVRLR